MRRVRDLASRPLTVIALFLTLLALAPGCSVRAARPGPETPAGEAGAPGAGAREARAPRRAATDDEQARYAERERSAAGLEKFEGGRIDTTAVVIILLLVIVIILIV